MNHVWLEYIANMRGACGQTVGGAEAQRERKVAGLAELERVRPLLTEQEAEHVDQLLERGTRKYSQHHLDRWQELHPGAEPYTREWAQWQVFEVLPALFASVESIVKKLEGVTSK